MQHGFKGEFEQIEDAPERLAPFAPAQVFAQERPYADNQDTKMFAVLTVRLVEMDKVVCFSFKQLRSERPRPPAPARKARRGSPRRGLQPRRPSGLVALKPETKDPPARRRAREHRVGGLNLRRRGFTASHS